MDKILMCHPKYFDVIYDINPWMTNQSGKVNNVIATTQWNRLLEGLSREFTINILDGIENCPDLVFTANAGFIKNKIAILSKFSKQQRQDEEIHFRRWFESKDYTVVQPENYYEGEGDHLVDGEGRHWLGTGFRTSAAVAPELETFLNKKINVLQLVDPRWYHLDTAFCPLPRGEILWYPPAFSLESQQLIYKSFKRGIEIKTEDALSFACNCVAVKNKLFLPKNKSASHMLKTFGYSVYEYDLSEFIKAGGAAKCLVLHCNK